MRKLSALAVVASLALAGTACGLPVFVDTDGTGVADLGQQATYHLEGPSPYQWYNVSGNTTIDIPVDTWVRVTIHTMIIGRFQVVDNGDDTYTVQTDPAYGGLTGVEGASADGLQVVFNNVDVLIDVKGAGMKFYIDSLTGFFETDVILRVPVGAGGGTGFRLYWGSPGRGNYLHFTVATDGTVAVTQITRAGVDVVGGEYSLTFPDPLQVNVLVPKVELEAQGIPRWEIDGAILRSSPFAVDVAWLTFAGNYELYTTGSPAMPFTVPADVVDWERTVAHPDGIFEFVFSGPPPPGFLEYTVHDVTTGSQLFTNEREVVINLIPDGFPDGHLITESPVEPTEGWLPDPPTSYTITGDEGDITLYAWLKTGSTVVSQSRTIHYSTPEPVVSSVDFQPITAGKVKVVWSTDIPAEGVVLATPADGGETLTFHENAVTTGHSVIMDGVAEAVHYDVFLVNNEFTTGPLDCFYTLTLSVFVNTDGAGVPAMSVPANYHLEGPSPYQWYNNTGDKTINIPVYTWIRVTIPRMIIGRFQVVGNGDDTFSVQTDPTYGGLIGSQDVERENIEVTFNNVDLTVDVNGGQLTYYIDSLTGNFGSNITLRVPAGSGGNDGFQMYWGSPGSGNWFRFTVAADGTVAITQNTRPAVAITGGDASITFPDPLPVDILVPKAELEAIPVDRWDIDWGIGRARPFAETVSWLTFPGNYGLYATGFPGMPFTIPADIVGWEQTVAPPGGEFQFVFSGPKPAISITEFHAADQSSGSRVVTDSATVDVALAVDAPEGMTIDGYLVTETDVEPVDGWLAEPPATYDITGGEGQITLHAWVKSGDTVATAAAEILFSTATPVVSNVQVADNGDGTATATWDTDVPAEGAVKYGPASLLGSTPNATPAEGVAGTSHSVSFAIIGGINYKVILVNNEKDSDPFYWPVRWPTDGDANMDCRVNILDLIFIRNKLNQPVDTGDNWQGDINEDGRINILDLIFVRNKLNTACP